MRRARHQARQGRDHARHPERRRGGPQGPRRVGHRPHRRRGEAGRHPGRQDHAEGRDPALAGREAAARDLRREGRRRARQLAARAPGRAGHRHQRQGLLPQGHRARTSAPRRSRTPRRRSSSSDRERRDRRSSRTRAYNKIAQAAVGKETTRASWSTTRARCCSNKGRSSTTSTLDEVPRALLGEHSPWSDELEEEARAASSKKLQRADRS